MQKVLATSQGKTTEVDIPDKPGGINVIVHHQGIKVDVPEFVEINPRDTLDCMANMTQGQWEWVSTGPIFQELWKLSWDDGHASGQQTLPATIEELNNSDFGLIHVAGLITLGVEACIAGNSIFVRNPEIYLHPSTERCIMQMFHKMMELTGVGGGEVKVAEKDPPKIKKRKPKTKKRAKKKVAKKKEEPEPETPFGAQDELKETVLKWLKCMSDPEKPFAQIGNQVYTKADMILEVANDTDVGRQMIEKFVNMAMTGENKFDY